MNRIVRVDTESDYRLRVWFQDGKNGIFDLAPYLELGVFRNLKDSTLFSAVRVEYGTLVWPGEIDIAPDTVEADLIQAVPR